MIDPANTEIGAFLFYVEVDASYARPLKNSCVHKVRFLQAESASPNMCHIVHQQRPQFANIHDLFTNWEEATRNVLQRVGV